VSRRRCRRWDGGLFSLFAQACAVVPGDQARSFKRLLADVRLGRDLREAAPHRSVEVLRRIGLGEFTLLVAVAVDDLGPEPAALRVERPQQGAALRARLIGSFTRRT